MIWLAVVVRVLVNPLSNVWQKRLAVERLDPLFVVVLTHGLLSLGAVPWLCLVPPSDRFPAAANVFWPNLLLSALLAVVGNALLVAAMRRSDLSVLGPINAYKAVVSLLPGLLWLGEVPGWWAVAGIGLIVLGSTGLAASDMGHPRQPAWRQLWQQTGVQLRLAALVTSAIEAVFIKRAVQVATPLATLAWWSVLGSLAGLAFLLPWDRARWRQQLAWAINRWPTCSALAVSTGLMQGCTLVVLGGMQVGAALALFQCSALVSVLLGHHLFGEPHLARRLTASLSMAAGAALIVLFGK